MAAWSAPLTRASADAIRDKLEDLGITESNVAAQWLGRDKAMGGLGLVLDTNVLVESTAI